MIASGNVALLYVYVKEGVSVCDNQVWCCDLLSSYAFWKVWVEVLEVAIPDERGQASPDRVYVGVVKHGMVCVPVSNYVYGFLVAE